MVNGFTSIGIVRKGKPMEVQKWPNLATTLQLRQMLVETKPQGWNFTWDSEGGGMPERAWITVAKVEIVYKGAGKDLWALEHVQGVSLSGGYFDEHEYPMQEYLSTHILEPEPPDDYHRMANQLRSVIPGIMTPVPYPCDCNRQGDGAVWGIIQHLNDEHHPLAAGVTDKWTRERIADWTEELPVDLTVDPERSERLKAKKRERAERTRLAAETIKKNGPKILEHLLAMQESAVISKDAMMKIVTELNEEET